MKISPRQYAKLIQETTQGLEESQVNEVLNKIIKLIKKNKDKKIVKKIIQQLKKIYLKETGELPIEITSVRKLKENQINMIKEKIAQKNNLSPEKIIISNVIKNEIKGGLIVRIKDQIIDGSLKGKMAKLKKALK